MCEGDDYWTDPYKLQKQYDFMEANPDYSICCTDCFVINYNDKTKTNKKRIPFHLIGYKKDLTIKDLLYVNFIPTNTAFYRWDYSIISELKNGILSGDWYLNMLLAKRGKIKILSGLSAVYRKHDKGLSWFLDEDCNIFYSKYGQKQIRTFYYIYIDILNYSEEYCKNMLLPELSKLIGILYQKKDLKQLKDVFNEYPELVGRCIYERQARYKKWFDRFLKLSIVLGTLLFITVFVLFLYIFNIL